MKNDCKSTGNMPFVDFENRTNRVPRKENGLSLECVEGHIFVLMYQRLHVRHGVIIFKALT